MNPIFKIISYTKHLWKWYVVMGVFVVLTSLLTLAGPLLSKQIVDLIVAKIKGEPVNFEMFWWFLGGIILVDILITVLTSVGQWIGDQLAVRLQTYLSQKFYHHVLNLHIGYYDNEIAGRIVNKMYRGITSITEFIQNMLNNFLPFFLTALVTIILLAQYSLTISILLTVLFPIYVLISHGSTNAWRKHEAEKNILNDSSQGRVFESLTGIRVVKAFVGEIAEWKFFLTNRKNIEKITIRQSLQWHWYDFARRLCLNVILFAIFLMVVWRTYEGEFTLGEMTLLLQLVNQARFPLFAMSFILGQIQQASEGSADFFRVLETKTEIADRKDASVLHLHPEKQTKSPIISFDRVFFSYEKGKAVLKNISFGILPNEKFALVGGSGEGKSTIINLLLRFYEPTKGSISMGGRNVASVTQESLHQSVAVVFQEALLFSGTIMENIAYGKPGATKDEVVEAAKAANAHEFIKQLSNGYDSTIGERGVKLSGGQKQRISIARAMLKNAPIIILDEATSSLDSKSELEVQKGLDRLMKNRTSVIIAHRLSTIANADHIIVLSGGSIDQYGRPKELLKDDKGMYAKLVNLQKLMLNNPEEAKKALEQFDIVG